MDETGGGWLVEAFFKEKKKKTLLEMKEKEAKMRGTTFR
jgi:hypothetical protein